MTRKVLLEEGDLKIGGIAALLATLLLPLGLNAQGYDRGSGGHDSSRNHDDGSRRVSGIIADCERRTGEFKVALKRALDRSPLDGSRREDELNRDAAKLERAMRRLMDSWNADKDYGRSRKNLGVAISAGQDIDRTMSRHRLRGHLQNDWNVVRNELNRLAEVFKEPKIRWD